MFIIFNKKNLKNNKFISKRNNIPKNNIPYRNIIHYDYMK